MPLFSLLGIGACSPYAARDSVGPPISQPAHFAGSIGSASTAAMPDRWWKDFADPQLDELIESALTGNLDLGAAWARLDQAFAIARRDSAALWPEVNIDASASRVQSLFFAGGGFESTFKAEQLIFTAAATYELDLWRRVWSLKRAGDFDLLASRDDLETMAMTIAAQVADAWVNLIEQRAERELLAAQARASGRFLRLTELRFAQGLASALDVYQQRQQLAATRAQIPIAEMRMGESANRLAVLLGKAPGSDVVKPRATLPALPPPPATGIPAQLLQRRPDVRAAAVRVAAADHRVAAAVADRLPAIRLTVRGGYETFTPGLSIFDSSIWSLVGNLAAPVIDGGRRRAEVARTKAVVAERLQVYGNVLLRALEEVENALLREHGQQERLDEIERQVAFSRRALEEAQARYVGGLSDYLPVLTALEGLQQAERSELVARRELISFRIQLYRALGGSWTDDVEEPLRVSSAAEPEAAQQ